MAFNYKGKEYGSRKAYCESIGLKDETVKKRLRRGKTLEEALNPELNYREVPDHKGNVYKNTEEMCRAYGITVDVYKQRKKKGLSLKDILEKE